jgi:hypothetical protein
VNRTVHSAAGRFLLDRRELPVPSRLLSRRRVVPTATAALLLLAGSGTALAVRRAQNPMRNSAPSPATVRACLAPRYSVRSCDMHALADVDLARRSEGVAPISLPGDFFSLSTAERLLALADLERVDRGLAPVLGLTARLDAAAAQAARAQADPTGPNGYSWGSNWAGGTRSTVFDDFSWMYDDGFGSQNLACRVPNAGGCWGHRDNILAPFQAPVAMGASASGTSLTELLVADYQPAATGSDPLLGPTWAQIAKTLPVGVSQRAIRLGGARTARTSIWASGEPMSVTATISPGRGAAAWSVTPTRCQLAPGSACTLTLAAPRRHGQATLVLSGPNGRQSVPLS